MDLTSGLLSCYTRGCEESKCRSKNATQEMFGDICIPTIHACAASHMQLTQISGCNLQPHRQTPPDPADSAFKVLIQNTRNQDSCEGKWVNKGFLLILNVCLPWSPPAPIQIFNKKRTAEQHFIEVGCLSLNDSVM